MNNYKVLTATDEYIHIKDLDNGKTITNSAEEVVRDLTMKGLVPKITTKIYYTDTDGDIDELGHDGLEFTGYKLSNPPTRDINDLVNPS